MFGTHPFPCYSQKRIVSLGINVFGPGSSETRRNEQRGTQSGITNTLFMQAYYKESILWSMSQLDKASGYPVSCDRLYMPLTSRHQLATNLLSLTTFTQGQVSPFYSLRVYER
jgi:hypothetical protein